MNKILGVSIMALLAVSPMLANATVIQATDTYTDPTRTGNNGADNNASANDPQYALVQIDDAEQGHIASTAYVKGAYNSTIRAVNRVAQMAGASVQSVAEGTTNGTIRVNGTTDVPVHGLGTAAYKADTYFDLAGAAQAVADKMDDGASGYDINAKSLQVQGKEAVTVSDTQILTNKTISATNNTISDLATTNLKSGVLATTVRPELVEGAEGYTDWYGDKTIPSEKAVRSAITTATTGMVTAASQDNFTNKTFDAEGTGNSITNLKTTNIKPDTLIISSETFADDNDTKIPTVKAVNTVLSNTYATKTGVQATIGASSGTTSITLYKAWGNDDADTGTQNVTLNVSLTGASYVAQ